MILKTRIKGDVHIYYSRNICNAYNSSSRDDSMKQYIIIYLYNINQFELIYFKGLKEFTSDVAATFSTRPFYSITHFPFPLLYKSQFPNIIFPPKRTLWAK